MDEIEDAFFKVDGAFGMDYDLLYIYMCLAVHFRFIILMKFGGFHLLSVEIVSTKFNQNL